MTLSYSDEDVVEIMVDIPDDDLESEEHKLEVLQEVKDEIAETGGVNYDLAITLETLMEGCISKQMPLRSFTKQHSLTNYNVAIEGIDKVTKYVKENILDKVVEAIKKLIQWLASLFARSGSSSDKPQKEKIAESVKSATRNDTRQKNETKREQDIAKRISRVDALSKTLVESIQKDMEGNAEFNSSGSDVEKTFMDIRKFYATIGLRGKFSPFIYQLTVKHDGSDLANATKLMTLLTEHISLVFIEIGALSKAIDNNQEFPPRQGFMPYERYNTILKSFKNVKYNEAENKGLPTVTEFKKGLYEYIKLDDTIKVENFDDVTWHGAASYFEGASQRMGEKFIEQVLHVNNIITKIQTKLKAEKDDATVGLYLPAVEMIKDEIAYITHVSSIIDLLEVACGNFANAYNKKVIDASRYFVQLFNNRVKKMEGLDNETKDKILEYVNAKDDKTTAALESLLTGLEYSYLQSAKDINNLSLENFLDKVTDALMNFLSNTFTKLYDILKGKLTDQEVALKTGKKNAALLEKNTKDLLRIGKIYEHRDTQREVVNAVKSLSSGKNASNVLLGAILKPEDTVYIHLFEEKFAKQEDILFTPHLALDSDFNFTAVLKTVVKTDGATAQNRSFINDMLAKSKKELTTKLILFTAYHDDGSKYDHRDLDDETNLLKAIKENMNFLLAPADEYYRIPDTDVLVGFIRHVIDIYKYLDVHVGNMKGALTNIQKWEGMLNTIPESTKVPKDTMDGIKDFVYTYAIMVKTSIFIVDSLLKTVNGIVEALLTNSNKVIEACKDL